MGEDSFRFKQFTIAQNRQIHRVGTDGVLLGAWTTVNQVNNLLDVGTGTGLIALMLAQRTGGSALIHALEPDSAAVALARYNIQNCAFAKHALLYNSRLQDFAPTQLYDLIVCNPPFFNNSLKPTHAARTSQRHTVNLTLEDLVKNVSRLLSPQGRLSVILPCPEATLLENFAVAQGLFTHRLCMVFSKQGKQPKRTLLEFGRQPKPLVRNILTLMDTAGAWTPAYQELTEAFYLKF